MLEIYDLRVWVSIGCSEEERSLLQCISIDIAIDIKNLSAMISDNIEDTICYAKIVNSIEELCQNRQFKLIEYLAREIFITLKNLITLNFNKIVVKVKKIHTSIKNVYGHVSFTYSE